MEIKLIGKKAVKNPRKSWLYKGKDAKGYTKYGTGSETTIFGRAFDLYDTEKEAGKHSFRLKRKSKFVPKGIDPAFPQKNFVKAHYENKGDPHGFYEDMFSFDSLTKRSQGKLREISSRYKGETRRGDLRLSGSPKAHQIGKRKK